MGNLVLNITLFHYLILAILLFTIGFIGIIVSKNVVKILIMLEIMLASVNINFIAFSSFVESQNLTGYIFSIFYTAISAIELGVALVIFYLLFKQKNSPNINDYEELKN